MATAGSTAGSVGKEGEEGEDVEEMPRRRETRSIVGRSFAYGREKAGSVQSPQGKGRHGTHSSRNMQNHLANIPPLPPLPPHPPLLTRLYNPLKRLPHILPNPCLAMSECFSRAAVEEEDFAQLVVEGGELFGLDGRRSGLERGWGEGRKGCVEEESVGSEGEEGLGVCTTVRRAQRGGNR